MVSAYMVSAADAYTAVLCWRVTAGAEMSITPYSVLRRSWVDVMRQKFCTPVTASVYPYPSIPDIKMSCYGAVFPLLLI